MGINLIDQIVPKNSGSFPMVSDEYLLGGWRSVANTGSRDEISIERQRQGMRVYVQDEDKTYYLSGSNWVEVSNVVETITSEELVFEVDYNDVSASQIPDGTVFTTQSEIDVFLTTQGATSFKYFEECYNALPSLVAHPIRLNLAAGVHRPRPGVSGKLWAFEMIDKTLIKALGFLEWPQNDRANISIIGDLDYDNWTVLDGHSSLSIQSINTGDDPSVSLTVAPLTTDAYKGYFAYFPDTGQIQPISENTTDEIFILDGVVGSPTTVSIVRPSTIIRNADDTDTSGVYFRGWQLNCGGGLGDIGVKGIDFDVGASFSGFGVTGGAVKARTCLFNARTARQVYGWNPDISIAGATSVIGVCTFTAYYCSFISWDVKDVSDKLDNLFVLSKVSNTCKFDGRWCYFQGSNEGILIQGADFSCASAVFDNVGSSVAGDSRGYIYVTDGGSVSTFQFSGDKAPIIRGCPVGSPLSYDPSCLKLKDGSNYFAPSAASQLRFENNAVDCVHLQSRSNLITVDGSIFSDEGGNLGVGIKVLGSHCIADLGDAVSVSGSAGEIELPDGSQVTYADIQNGAVVTDNIFDLIRRAP